MRYFIAGFWAGRRAALRRAFCVHRAHLPNHETVEIQSPEGYIDLIEMISCSGCEKTLAIETMVKGDASHIYELVGARL